MKLIFISILTGHLLTAVAQAPGPAHIGIIRRDGSGSSLIVVSSASDEEPDWSPDGKRIAFDSGRNGNNDIFIIDIKGKNLQQLTNSPAKEDHASWSPDGKRIAYQHEWQGNTDVYVMNADGSNKTRLTTHAARDGWPDWSPDGSLIVFSSERDGQREIYVMNRNGDDQKRLTNSAEQCKSVQAKYCNTILRGRPTAGRSHSTQNETVTARSTSC